VLCAAVVAVACAVHKADGDDGAVVEDAQVRLVFGAVAVGRVGGGAEDGAVTVLLDERTWTAWWRGR
jgi:hypothetical protein